MRKINTVYTCIKCSPAWPTHGQHNKRHTTRHQKFQKLSWHRAEYVLIKCHNMSDSMRSVCVCVCWSGQLLVNEGGFMKLFVFLLACPSGCMPCSRQKSSQAALPICTPAWPMWMLITSLWTGGRRGGVKSKVSQQQILAPLDPHQRH